jgi:cysteine desulfurase
MSSIYLDHSASTSVLPAVWEAMQPFFKAPGNPASSHHAGRHARRALTDARERIASLLDAHPDEVIFTSGATEANNLALFGSAGDPPSHLLSSPVEHPCAIEPLRQLSKAGHDLGFLTVDVLGRVSPDQLAHLLRPDTRLVCVQLANHETGTLQPIQELTAVCPSGVVFHCDAAAAAGKLPVRFHELGVTTLTLSGHKFHGPKGIGALLVRREAKLRPLLYGGHQQQGRRPGTEPVPLAVGLAVALELAVKEMAQRQQRVLDLRRRFLDQLRAAAGPLVVNGPQEGSVPHILNVSFPGCRADLLLMKLDLAGVACSTGSACSSGSLLPSPVLEAMGVPSAVLHSAMRFSFSHLLSEAEVEQAAQRVAEVVARLRRDRVD